MTRTRRAAASAALVVALAGCSAAAPSPERPARAATASPGGGAPVLRAAMASPTDVDLSWSGGSPEADGHVLEFATEEAGPYTVLQYLPRGVTSYRHPDLMPRTRFVYRLRAYSGPASPVVDVDLPPGGMTAQDEESSHDWLPPRTDPSRTAPGRHALGEAAAAPAGLRATVRHANGILFTWTDRAADEDGFLLESRTAGAAAYTPLVVLDPDINATGLITLPAEKHASYRVRAFAYGEPSAVVALTTGTSAADPG